MIDLVLAFGSIMGLAAFAAVCVVAARLDRLERSIAPTPTSSIYVGDDGGLYEARDGVWRKL